MLSVPLPPVRVLMANVACSPLLCEEEALLDLDVAESDPYSPLLCRGLAAVTLELPWDLPVRQLLLFLRLLLSLRALLDELLLLPLMLPTARSSSKDSS